ncbi:prepilin peptidase [Enterocloster clostridioformis]|uniref:prepilin peptidase n=1 Tax=Enterocloster clostridioformis TaxID=1531 RepID=UPI0008E9A574|nr:prepilin peptidase [Enterocloster clostridioformis]SFG53924.1 leader peptidase (prepilin peptidase) / N-methyltransferase [Enterocloster clostridioformis]
MPDSVGAALAPFLPRMQVVQAGLFLILLFLASVWDLRFREIPDSLQAAVASLTLLCFCPGNLLGVLGAVPYLLVALFFHGMDGMGGGDIKLAAATGVVLGLSASLLSSVIGLSAFILYSIVYTATTRLHGKKGRIAFPVGPFLALGAAAAYFIKHGGIL